MTELHSTIIIQMENQTWEVDQTSSYSEFHLDLTGFIPRGGEVIYSKTLSDPE